MYRVLVADDERLGRQRIIDLLSPYSDFKVCQEVSDGDELEDALIDSDADIAFLDINMPGKSVFNVLDETDYTGAVVFQTAYSEFAVDAFNHDAADYLMKPVSRLRFEECIEKLRTRVAKAAVYKRSEPYVSLKQGDVTKLVKISNIAALNIEGGIVQLILSDDTCTFSDKPLNFFEEILPSDVFFRTSRNSIINISHILSVQKLSNGTYLIEMNSGGKIALSRRRAADLKKIIGDF